MLEEALEVVSGGLEEEEGEEVEREEERRRREKTGVERKQRNINQAGEEDF